jgi:hypothetical protein
MAKFSIWMRVSLITTWQTSSKISRVLFFFVGHAFENEHAAFAAMGLPRCAELLQKLPGIDTQKLFAFANDCSMDRPAASLGKIIIDLCGVPSEIKIDTFFRPHNGGNDAVMTYFLLLFKLSKLYNKLEVN